VDCANAIAKYNVGIKCATITPDEKRVEGEYTISNKTYHRVVISLISQLPQPLLTIMPSF